MMLLLLFSFDNYIVLMKEMLLILYLFEKFMMLLNKMLLFFYHFDSHSFDHLLSKSISTVFLPASTLPLVGC